MTDGQTHSLLVVTPFAVIGVFMAIIMHCLLTYVAAWYRHATGEPLDGHSLLSDYLLGMGVLKMPGGKIVERGISEWGPHEDPTVERLRLRWRGTGRMARPIFIMCVLCVVVFVFGGPFILRRSAR